MMTNNDLVNIGYKNWNTVETLIDVGAELEERSRFTESRTFLNRAIELQPDSTPQAYLSLAFTHFRDVTSSAETGEEMLVNGIENTNSDLLKAWHIAFVEENDIAERMVAALSESTSLEVQFTIANSILWRGDFKGAYEHCTKYSSELFSKPIEAQTAIIYVGLMTWLSNKFPEIDLENTILPLSIEIVRSKPESFSYQNARLMIAQTLKQWEKVKDYALEALYAIPDNETLMLALAIAYERLNEGDLAIMWYNRAIGAKHSYARARVRLAKLLQTLSKGVLAENIIREIPTANPHYKMGHIETAFMLFDLDKKDDAAKIFNSAYAGLKPYEKTAVDNNPLSIELKNHNSNTIIISTKQG